MPLKIQFDSIRACKNTTKQIGVLNAAGGVIIMSQVAGESTHQHYKPWCGY